MVETTQPSIRPVAQTRPVVEVSVLSVPDMAVRGPGVAERLLQVMDRHGLRIDTLARDHTVRCRLYRLMLHGGSGALHLGEVLTLYLDFGVSPLWLTFGVGNPYAKVRVQIQDGARLPADLLARVVQAVGPTEGPQLVDVSFVEVPDVAVRGPDVFLRIRDVLKAHRWLSGFPWRQDRVRRAHLRTLARHARGSVNTWDLRYLWDHFRVSPLWVVFGVGPMYTDTVQEVRFRDVGEYPPMEEVRKCVSLPGRARPRRPPRPRPLALL